MVMYTYITLHICIATVAKNEDENELFTRKKKNLYNEDEFYFHFNIKIKKI